MGEWWNKPALICSLQSWIEIPQAYELHTVNFSASRTATFYFFSLPETEELQQTLLKIFFSPLRNLQITVISFILQHIDVQGS